MGSFFPVLLRYGKRTCAELFEAIGLEDERLLYFLLKIFGGRDFSAIGFMMVLNGLPMELHGLQGFTMIGQWLFPGGGLPPSAQSGKWAIQKLVKASGKPLVV